MAVTSSVLWPLTLMTYDPLLWSKFGDLWPLTSVMLYLRHMIPRLSNLNVLARSKLYQWPMTTYLGDLKPFTLVEVILAMYDPLSRWPMTFYLSQSYTGDKWPLTLVTYDLLHPLKLNWWHMTHYLGDQWPLPPTKLYHLSDLLPLTSVKVILMTADLAPEIPMLFPDVFRFDQTFGSHGGYMCAELLCSHRL